MSSDQSRTITPACATACTLTTSRKCSQKRDSTNVPTAN